MINTKTRTIELTLSDTVDIKRVYLNTLEITADPAREQSVDIRSGNIFESRFLLIDFIKAFSFFDQSHTRNMSGLLLPISLLKDILK